jgi:thiosulfate/3-mercaptopyruvate sulfurtransferase
MMPVKDGEVVLRKTVTTGAAIALIGTAVLVPSLHGVESSDSPAGSAAVRSEMLVSTSWLQQHLADRDLVVLYVGEDRTQFDEGHVPSARFLPLDELVEQRKDSLNELPPVSDLKALFESLGVADNSRVILIGDRAGLSAARAYFTLDYLGHGENAALLDGGSERWTAESRPLSRDHVHAVPANFTPRLQTGIFVGTSEMRSLSGSASTASAYVLLDARPVNEFDGVVKSEAVAQAGHIPGARTLYWKKLIRSGADPELLDPADLEQLFTDAGVRPGQKVVTYCRTGMQSSFSYFVAKYLGYEAAMYDGSVYEWVNTGNDLVISPERASTRPDHQ